APVDAHELSRVAVAEGAQEPLGGNLAPLVEAIDVLRDQQMDTLRPAERGERLVRRIGAGSGDHLPGLPLVAPVALAGCRAREKIRKRHRLVALPSPAGRAKVGNARGRGETGARENHDVTGSLPPARQRLDLL